MAVEASGKGVHHDVPLSNIAIKAFQTRGQYIAEQLMPVIEVDKQTNRYYTFDKASALTVENTVRAPKTEANIVSFKVSSDSYTCDNHALRGSNALEDLSNADKALRLRTNTTNNVVDKLLRAYEVRVANQTTSGTNLGSYVALSGGNKYSDDVNSNPIADVTTGHAFIRQQTGLVANTAVIDLDTLAILRVHPLMLEKYKYTKGGLLTMEDIKDAFSVDTILKAGGVKNNANEGQTASITNIWGNSILLAHIEQGVSLETATFGISMRWQPAGITKAFQTMRYLGTPSEKAEYVEVGYYQDEKIVSTDLIYGILTTL